MKHAILLPVLFVFIELSNAQVVNCNTRVLSMSTPPMQTFTFDKFSHYTGGVTQVGATILRVEVDSIDFNPDCRWKIVVEVDNNYLGASLPTNINEWESLAQYGNFSTPPEIEILEIRVINNCQSVTLPVGYNPLFINSGDQQDIMKNPIPNQSVYPDECPSNPVNSPGSYITQPGAYTFVIDYRLKPGLDYRPGLYQISLKYKLEEDL